MTDITNKELATDLQDLAHVAVSEGRNEDAAALSAGANALDPNITGPDPDAVLPDAQQ
jgi:hypothetical protein